MLTADKEEDKFRDRQAVIMAEKHVCEPPIEAAGRQIQIYIGAEIQIHAGIHSKTHRQDGHKRYCTYSV
jgi:hypothetical protein